MRLDMPGRHRDDFVGLGRWMRRNALHPTGCGRRPHNSLHWSGRGDLIGFPKHEATGIRNATLQIPNETSVRKLSRICGFGGRVALHRIGVMIENAASDGNGTEDESWREAVSALAARRCDRHGVDMVVVYTPTPWSRAHVQHMQVMRTSGILPVPMSTPPLTSEEAEILALLPMRCLAAARPDDFLVDVTPDSIAVQIEFLTPVDRLRHEARLDDLLAGRRS